MIDDKAFLKEMRTLRGRLEADLRERCDADADLDTRLRSEWTEAQTAGRTAEAYSTWRDGRLTQAAVAWILAAVFVRFCEDNDLVGPARLGGPGPRLQLARDHKAAWFREHPELSDTDWLIYVYEDVARLPAMEALLGRGHSPLWDVVLSGDGGRTLLETMQQVDPGTGLARWDFTDDDLDTRFLGDLYQDLSADARKRFALWQTPNFVEELILDRTLTPAIDEFGYAAVKVIDPTCGSGHFLLGAFDRLWALRRRHAPDRNARVLAQQVLDQLAGVDLNPFATAICRFRLLVAALDASGVRHLEGAPDFRVHVATGDSLLFGARSGQLASLESLTPETDRTWAFSTEDAAEAERILNEGYHVVVGNPPYITVKDKALNAAYRERYKSCHRSYALTVPFMERFFDLATGGVEGEHNTNTPGYVGMITANSFMKREFGKKLVEDFIPRWDLTHVVDTSGAYIPGHGTPTVILVARNRRPITSTVRAVMGIRGEPTTPSDPAQGLVWRSVVENLDKPGTETEYVSVTDIPRVRLEAHPWSLGGGGAAALADKLSGFAPELLGELVAEIGFGGITGEDNALVLDSHRTAIRLGVESIRPLVVGDAVRDWEITDPPIAVWPYDDQFQVHPLEAVPNTHRLLWPYRRVLQRRKRFGVPIEDIGLPWHQWREVYADRLRTPLSIAFAFVATHNHFVLDRGGKVFKQSAPVIKLPEGADEDAHLGLVGLLNSSVACFWMQQVFHNKGGPGGASSKDEKWHDFFEFDGTKLKQFPVPSERPLGRARWLDSLAQRLAATTPAALCSRETPTAEGLAAARKEWESTLAEMIAVQEELDWECHRIYGLTPTDLCAPAASVPPLELGQRAFEIVLARRVAAGAEITKWFEKLRATPTTELPAEWPAAYRDTVEARIAMIESDRDVGLVERPNTKRRWNTEPWQDQQAKALRTWLLDRLEAPSLWDRCALLSCGQIADRLATDPEFSAVAALYAGRDDVDLTRVVTELAVSEAVPYLAALRYKDSGLAKRAVWERTWELQRREDADEDVGDIAVPPRYSQADFRSTVYWRMRGKLDVPKERFVSYPGAERPADGTPVLGWAGWDHLQQAQALASYMVERETGDGWPPHRLVPLLAGVAELVPWLRQWHDEPDASGRRMGTYFADFVDEEARRLGVTTEHLSEWRSEGKSAT